MSRVELVCEACGLTFVVAQWETGLHGRPRRFCTATCSYSHKVDKTCVRCGRRYLGSEQSRYCGPDCYGIREVRTCVVCELQFEVKNQSSRQRYCTRRCARVAQTLADPRRRPRVNSNGYVEVPVAAEDRWLTNGKDWPLEHRLAMARHLGRPLRANETVHHRNGDRLDNRLDNLELMVLHPKGQRVTDVLAWAYEIVERYGSPSGQLSLPL